MAYKVSFEGEEFNTDDLTLDEAIGIERSTGRSWVLINPFRSAEDCKAIIVAFLTRTRDETEATKLVGALSLREVLASVSVAEDDLPEQFEGGIPLAGDDTSTDGSSGPGTS